MEPERRQLMVQAATALLAQLGSVDFPLVVSCLIPGAASPANPGGSCVGAGMEKMLVPPQQSLRVLEKRMSVPSGDQSGNISYTVLSLLRLVDPEPSAFMAQICQTP